MKGEKVSSLISTILLTTIMFLCMHTVNSYAASKTQDYTNKSKSSYTISYNLNGGSVVLANPKSYNTKTPTITLQNPTKLNKVFWGWTGSNDVSSGMNQYTVSAPYIASSRDHILGNEFKVTPGTTYRVFITAKRNSGSLNLQGGIWYTKKTRGNEWDGYLGEFHEIEKLNNGWSRYYKDITVPSGKTEGKAYIQIEQNIEGGSTKWKIANISVTKTTENVQIQTGSTGNRVYVANWNGSSCLDIYGVLDGHKIKNSELGTFDLYINGKKIADDVSNIHYAVPYGSTYAISDLKVKGEYIYNGVRSGGINGTIGTTNTNVEILFSTANYYISSVKNGQKYSLTLNDSLSRANDNSTVKLLRTVQENTNATLDTTEPARRITLDLQANTIIMNNSRIMLRKGKLIVSGTGTIKGSDSLTKSLIHCGGGSLELKSKQKPHIINTNAGAITVNNDNSKLNIQSGIIYSTNASAIVIQKASSSLNNPINICNAKVVSSTANSAAIALSSDYYRELDNGDFEWIGPYNSYVYISKSTVINGLNNDTYMKDLGFYSQPSNSASLGIGHTGKVIINGGNIATHFGGYAISINTASVNPKLDLEINGGANIYAYQEGYECIRVNGMGYPLDEGIPPTKADIKINTTGILSCKGDRGCILYRHEINGKGIAWLSKGSCTLTNGKYRTKGQYVAWKQETQKSQNPSGKTMTKGTKNIAYPKAFNISTGEVTWGHSIINGYYKD